MRNRTTAVAALAALALLAGCSNAEPDVADPTTPSSATTTGTPSPDPQAGGRDDLLESPTSSAPAPTWDEAAEQSVLSTAADFIAAYLDTAQPEADWLAGITRFIDPAELGAFSTIDPMNIPYGAISGEPQRLVDEIDSPYVAVVRVPVDDTSLRVTLARSDGDAPWLVVDLAQD